MHNYKTLFIFLSLFLFLCPSATSTLAAESCTTSSGQTGIISSTTGSCVPMINVDNPSTTTTSTTGKGLVPCGHGDSPADACTLCDFIVGFKNLISFGLELLIAVAVAGIFVAGVMYIISAGNEQLLTKAKTFLSASLIGFTIVLTAWLLVNVVMWALSFDPAMTIQKASWYDFECKPSQIP